MMETEVLPVVCGLAPEFLLHLAGESVIANRGVLRAAVNYESIDDSMMNEQFVRSLVRLPTTLYPLAAARLAWSRFQDEIYVDQVGLLTRHVFLQPVGESIVWRNATDIVANEIGVDLLATDPFAIRLEQGVLDTNAEALLERGILLRNTGEAFAASSDWVKLTPDDPERLTNLPFPSDARSRIAQELLSGYLVVAPQTALALGPTPYVGWWRIDPVNGHTLGIDENGWGATFAEYAMTFALTFSSELVVCSAMHEFVAVARDGASWGTGAWNGLGRCVAAAFAAGALATLFLVAVTVAPRLFFGALRAGSGGGPPLPPGPPGPPPAPPVKPPASPVKPSTPPTKPPVNPMAQSHPGPGAPPGPNSPKPPVGNPPSAPPAPSKPPITADDFQRARKAVDSAMAESQQADNKFWDYRKKKDMYKDPSWNPQEDQRLLDLADQAAQRAQNAIGARRQLERAYQEQRASNQGLGGPVYGPPVEIPSIPGGLPKGPLSGRNKVATGAAGVTDSFWPFPWK
jgi:hypothetical protein